MKCALAGLACSAIASHLLFTFDFSHRLLPECLHQIILSLGLVALVSSSLLILYLLSIESIKKPQLTISLEGISIPLIHLKTGFKLRFFFLPLDCISVSPLKHPFSGEILSLKLEHELLNVPNPIHLSRERLPSDASDALNMIYALIILNKNNKRCAL